MEETPGGGEPGTHDRETNRRKRASATMEMSAGKGGHRKATG